MKMKKIFVLLITMLLSSCQISSNSETSSEQISDSISTIESISNSEVQSESSSELTEEPSESTSEPIVVPTEESSSEHEEVEDIYYVDGLPSNLFVTDIMEEHMTFTYYEDYDFYQVTVSSKEEKSLGTDLVSTQKESMIGKELEGQDIVIPNVYDDGIHGLKRVKAYTISRFEEGYLNSLIVSEGIEMCGYLRKTGYTTTTYILAHSPIILNPIKNIYLPSTIMKLQCFVPFAGNLWYYPNALWGFKFEPNIYYNGTIEQWNKIEFIKNYYEEGNYKFVINCLDGITYETDYAIVLT